MIRTLTLGAIGLTAASYSGLEGYRDGIAIAASLIMIFVAIRTLLKK